MDIKIFCIRWDGDPITDKIMDMLYETAQDMYRMKVSYVSFDPEWCECEVFTEWEIKNVENITGCVFFSTIKHGSKETSIEFIAREEVLEKDAPYFWINQNLIETEFGEICRN